jgi:uncharacterized protein (DUF2164 family)
MIKKLQDYLSEREYENWIDKAEAEFRAEIVALQAISNTAGYGVIKSYQKKQVDLARERLKTMKSTDDLVRVQTKLQDAEEFLSYLERIESITE